MGDDIVDDDIVERLRFLVDDGWYPTTHTEAAEEIERLRAENDNLRAALAVKDNHDHFDCTAERQELRLERDRLQALIDALAAVPHLEVGTDDWWQAIDALLAAATKEDDR